MKILSKISWNFVYQKLEKLQKKITENQSAKNKRICRNLQRLLQKTSFIQLLIIKNYVLEKKSIVNLKYQKYRDFLNFKLKLQLWSFVLLPIINLSQLRGFLRQRLPPREQRHAASPSLAGVSRAPPLAFGERSEGTSGAPGPRRGRKAPLVEPPRLRRELRASVRESTRPFIQLAPPKGEQIKYVLILFLTGKKSYRVKNMSGVSSESQALRSPLVSGARSQQFPPPPLGGASGGASQFIKYNGLIIIPFYLPLCFAQSQLSALPKFKIIEKYVKNQKLQIKFAKLYSILGKVEYFRREPQLGNIFRRWRQNSKFGL